MRKLININDELKKINLNEADTKISSTVFMEKILEKHSEFYEKLLTELFGRTPDLEKDKGRVNLVFDGFRPNEKQVWLDGNLAGFINEQYENPIKFEFNPIK